MPIGTYFYRDDEADDNAQLSGSVKIYDLQTGTVLQVRSDVSSNIPSNVPSNIPSNLPCSMQTLTQHDESVLSVTTTRLAEQEYLLSAVLAA